MKHHDYLKLIPAQHSGREIEVESNVSFDNIDAATIFYEKAKDRLLDINNWDHIAGLVSAKFQVVGAGGKEVINKVEKGYYLRIDIPGPGSKAGDGYDWVFVEELLEKNERGVQSIGFRVRPSENPLGNPDETAHFYSQESTSNFIVTREENQVYAWIVDRNIKPNQNASSVTDKIRDSTIGTGALGIFSKIQWQGLADGLLKQEK
ncbi:hypothetical protein [Flavitalea sp.]|nr:hypothetical protein [Flavitalea sp.]